MPRAALLERDRPLLPARSGFHEQSSQYAKERVILIRPVDHCGPEFVQTDAGAPADAECCKDWLWLDNKRVSAYYCCCYATGTRSCNVSIGDELVGSCP